MRLIRLLLAFAFALLCGGCDLFQTRAPQEPEQSSSQYTPPTEPSIVFSNMSNAFRDLNTVNYLRSFADSSASGLSFTFEASPVARAAWTSLFLSWGRESEQMYFENMKSRLPAGVFPSLVLTVDQQSLGSDSVVAEATYQLQVPHQLASVPQTARGRAQFALAADHSRNWVITRWIDLPNAQNDFTWSEMKGKFAQ